MTAATLAATPAAPRLFDRVGALFTTIAAVHRVKVALESRRQPAAADLDVLGIDPASMPDLSATRV